MQKLRVNMFNVKEIEKCEDKNREKSLNISLDML